MRWERLVERAPWRARAMPRGGQVDGTFVLLGGRSGPARIHSDTWSSPDGVRWERQSARSGWGARCYPEVDVVDGDLVLTGGQDLRTFHNDVWRSSDLGRTWERVCDRAPWGVRAGHHTCVLGEELLLFGGARRSVDRRFYPELWVSSDRGETWEQRAELPPDMGRAGMQVVEVGGTLYFMGGDHDRPVFQPTWSGRRNDVWSSRDGGRTWDLLGHAPWSPRTGHQCVAHDGTVYLVGGHVRGPRGERWRQYLSREVWAWDPGASGEALEAWRLVDDAAWAVDASGRGAGKSDFMVEVLDGALWTFGGDREVLAPWPQDRDVWRAALPT